MFNSILCSYDMFVHQKRWNKEQLSSVVMQQLVDVPNGRVTWWDLLMNAARIKCLYIKRVEQKDYSLLWARTVVYLESTHFLSMHKTMK